MAAHYMALSDDHLIKGALIINYQRAINNADFTPFFVKHGFAQVDPDQWYPAQLLMDVFTDMEANAQGFLNFVSVGMAIGDNLIIPPTVDIQSPAAVLSFLAVAQATMAQSSQPGYVHVERLSDQHYLIQFRGAGPDHYFYGLLYAVAKRFVPDSARILLKYPEGAPRRDKGDEYTVFDLSW